jgi:hypothetical protein
VCNIAVAKMSLRAEWRNMTEHRDKNIYPKLTAVLMIRVDFDREN